MIWVQYSQGPNVPSHSSITYLEMEFFKLNTDGDVKRWIISPQLPNGFVVKQYPTEFSGTLTEEMNELIFTISRCGTHSLVI